VAFVANLRITSRNIPAGLKSTSGVHTRQHGTEFSVVFGSWRVRGGWWRATRELEDIARLRPKVEGARSGRVAALPNSGKEGRG
jgi:hypothetical protein